MQESKMLSDGSAARKLFVEPRFTVQVGLRYRPILAERKLDARSVVEN